MLNWSRQDLSDAAKVADRTITDFERGARRPYERTLRDIEEAFVRAGVKFTYDEKGGEGIILSVTQWGDQGQAL